MTEMQIATCSSNTAPLFAVGLVDSSLPADSMIWTSSVLLSWVWISTGGVWVCGTASGGGSRGDPKPQSSPVGSRPAKWAITSAPPVSTA